MEKLITEKTSSTLRAKKPAISRKKAYVKAVKNYVEPTHFLTLSLVQKRLISGPIHGGTWIRGNDEIYSQVHEDFMRSLSKFFVNRNTWKRQKKMLRSTCVIEGGQNGMRHHLHILLAKPHDLDERKFRIAIHRIALNNPWIMNGEYAVNIQHVSKCADKINATFYCFKRGLDRVCFS